MESMMIWRAALEAARGFLGRLVMERWRWQHYAMVGLRLHRVRCAECELTTDWYHSMDLAGMAAEASGWRLTELRWRCKACIAFAREERCREAEAEYAERLRAVEEAARGAS